jgi:hypothetical protein
VIFERDGRRTETEEDETKEGDKKTKPLFFCVVSVPDDVDLKALNRSLKKVGGENLSGFI